MNIFCNKVKKNWFIAPLSPPGTILNSFIYWHNPTAQTLKTQKSFSKPPSVVELKENVKVHENVFVLHVAATIRKKLKVNLQLNKDFSAHAVGFVIIMNVFSSKLHNSGISLPNLTLTKSNQIKSQCLCRAFMTWHKKNILKDKCKISKHYNHQPSELKWIITSKLLNIQDFWYFSIQSLITG